MLLHLWSDFASKEHKQEALSRKSWRDEEAKGQQLLLASTFALMADSLLFCIDLLLEKSTVTLATTLLSLSEISKARVVYDSQLHAVGSINQKQLCQQQNNSRMIISFAVALLSVLMMESPVACKCNVCAETDIKLLCQ